MKTEPDKTKKKLKKWRKKQEIDPENLEKLKPYWEIFPNVHRRLIAGVYFTNPRLLQLLATGLLDPAKAHTHWFQHACRCLSGISSEEITSLMLNGHSVHAIFELMAKKDRSKPAERLGQ